MTLIIDMVAGTITRIDRPNDDPRIMQAARDAAPATGGAPQPK